MNEMMEEKLSIVFEKKDCIVCGFKIEACKIKLLFELQIAWNNGFKMQTYQLQVIISK